MRSILDGWSASGSGSSSRTVRKANVVVQSRLASTSKQHLVPESPGIKTIPEKCQTRSDANASEITTIPIRITPAAQRHVYHSQGHLLDTSVSTPSWTCIALWMTEIRLKTNNNDP